LHTPFAHVVGATHSVPHEPQLLLSVTRFAHVPEQLTNGAKHAHALSWHCRLPLHVAPQKPQFVLSFERFAHAPPAPPPPPAKPPPPPPAKPPPPHSVVGDSHESTHAPPEQSGVDAAQALPQAPQFALLELR
jgi:hypothetical protein